METKEKSQSVSLTGANADYRTAMTIANADGKLMGTIKVAFDQKFIESLKGSSIFVHWADAPKKDGWYQIDRKNHQFTPIPGQLRHGIPWHERLYVYPSAIRWAEHEFPLSLRIGCDLSDALTLVSVFSATDLARVAQVGAGHEAASSEKADVELRK